MKRVEVSMSVEGVWGVGGRPSDAYGGGVRHPGAYEGGGGGTQVRMGRAAPCLMRDQRRVSADSRRNSPDWKSNSLVQ
jgi:hypothetical protein